MSISDKNSYTIGSAFEANVSSTQELDYKIITLSQTDHFDAQKYSEVRKILMTSEKNLHESKARKALDKLSPSWTPCEKESVEKRILELPYGIQNVETEAQDIYKLITERRKLLLNKNFPKTSRARNQAITIASSDRLELKIIQEWFLNYVSKSIYHRTIQSRTTSEKIHITYTYDPSVHITDLPLELITEIFNYLDSQTLISFAKVNRQYRIWAEAEIAKRIDNHSIRFYKPMMPLILRNKEMKVIRLITGLNVIKSELNFDGFNRSSIIELDLSFGIGLENIEKLVSQSPQLNKLKLCDIEQLWLKPFSYDANISYEKVISQKAKTFFNTFFRDLAKNQFIMELDIICVKDNELDLRGTLVNLEQLKSLKVIKISGNFLESAEDKAALVKLPELKKLYINGAMNDITFLESLTNLEELHFTNLQPSKQSNIVNLDLIIQITALLPHLNYLESFTINVMSPIRIISRHIENFVMALTKVEKLKTLNYQQTLFFSFEHLKKLISIPTLERFYYNGEDLIKLSKQDIELNVDENKKLNTREIHLIKCIYSLSFFTKILQLFPSLPYLEILNLGSIKEKSLSNQELITKWNQCLPHLERLKSLRVDCSFLSPDHNEEFLKPLQLLRNLEVITLININIPENKIRAIIDNLSKLPKIKKMTISKVID